MKKKKQLILLIVFVAVILALVGALVGMSLHEKKKDRQEEEEASKSAEADEATLRIFNREAEDFVKIKYTNPSGEPNEYDYDAENDKWTAAADPEYPLSSTNLYNIASVCSHLKASKVVEENLSDPAVYGLDDPDYVVTVTDKDGKDTVLRIGMKNEYYKGYYLMVDGRSEVYLIGYTLPGYLDQNKVDMLGVERLNVPDQEYIHKLEVEDHYTIEYFPSGSTEYSYYPTDVYFLQHGEKDYTPADSDLAGSVLAAASTLNTSDYVAYKPTEEELDEMCLTEGKVFRITYTYEEAAPEGKAAEDSSDKELLTMVLEVGAGIYEQVLEGSAEEPKLTGYYVRMQGGDFVYKMDVEKVNTLFQVHEGDFFPKGYARLLLSNVEQFDVALQDGQKIHYEITCKDYDTYMYGNLYTLEYKSGDDWYVVPFLPDHMFTMEGHIMELQRVFDDGKCIRYFDGDEEKAIPYQDEKEADRIAESVHEYLDSIREPAENGRVIASDDIDLSEMCGDNLPSGHYRLIKGITLMDSMYGDCVADYDVVAEFDL